jgi:hypothetical protein
VGTEVAVGEARTASSSAVWDTAGDLDRLLPGSVDGKAIGLGWRVHSWRALVVAVRGPPTCPEIVHRQEITLVDDESTREPYHAAWAVPIEEVPALIGSVERAAAAAAAEAMEALVSSFGPVGAVGVVGGNRKVPSELTRRLASHAMVHASERDLYEQAVIRGAAIVGLLVTTVPATGRLFAEAADVLGVELEPALASQGTSVGRPWRKDHREATVAALVALESAG